MKNKKLQRLTIVALMSACCFIAFRFLKIAYPPIVTVHFGNVFCILTALLLGGIEGGVCGAIGMGIGDLLDPLYVQVFPKTLLCKMVMCIVAGVFFKKILNHMNEKPRVFLSILFGLIANMIMELVFGYIYYKYLLKTIDTTLFVFVGEKVLSTGITSTITLFATYLLYFPLYNRIKSYL